MHLLAGRWSLGFKYNFIIIFILISLSHTFLSEALKLHNILVRTTFCQRIEKLIQQIYANDTKTIIIK